MIERTICSEEHTQFRDSVRRFLEQEVIPHHDAWGE
jgi:acyl-CoA dehydrogenase